MNYAICSGVSMRLSITLGLAENGFTLEYCDPVVEARNREEDSKYESPYRTLVFSGDDAAPRVQEAVGKLLPTLMNMKQAEQADKSLAANFKDALKEITQ